MIVSINNAKRRKIEVNKRSLHNFTLTKGNFPNPIYNGRETAIFAEYKESFLNVMNRIYKGDAEKVVETSIYFVQHINTRRGFFINELHEILEPILDTLKIMKTEKTIMQITDILGSEDALCRDIFGDFIMLNNLDYLMTSTGAFEKLAESKEVVASKENLSEGPEGYNRELLRKIINSLTGEARLRFTVPKISITRNLVASLVTDSNVMDHDRLEYTGCHGQMYLYPELKIKNARNHAKYREIVNRWVEMRQVMNARGDMCLAKMFSGMISYNISTLDRLS